MRPVITIVPVLLLLAACSSGSSDGAEHELTVAQYRAQLTPRCQAARKQTPPENAPLDVYYQDVAAVLTATATAVRDPAPPASIRSAVQAQAAEATRIAGLMTTVSTRLAAQDTGTQTRTMMAQAEQAWTTWNQNAVKDLPADCTAT